MSLVFRRHLPLILTFIMGLIMIVQYFLVPETPVEPYQKSIQSLGEVLTNWANLLAGFTIGFGMVNVTLIHSRHLSRRTPGQWYYSAWLIFVAVIMVIVGLGGEPSLGINVSPAQYEWMTTYVLAACSGTMYSSLAFYITSACFRAFRARTMEATALLIVGFITLMSRTPAFQVFIPQAIEAADWINNYIVRSSFRGILIGGALGAILLGIRTLMGMETGYLGRRD